MDKTIDMAREAGLHIPYWGEEEDPKKDPPRWTMVSPLPPLLKAFEALVRADERERVMNEPLTKAQWQRFEDEIRADEREACAKVCSEWSDYTKGIAPTLAERIRARGTHDL